jgi:hypothetical protein
MPTRRAAEKIGAPDDPTRWTDTSVGRAWTIRKNAYSPAPLVISQVEWEPSDKPPYSARRQYYLWLFGPKIKLPLWRPFTPKPDDGKKRIRIPAPVIPGTPAVDPFGV